MKEFFNYNIIQIDEFSIKVSAIFETLLFILLVIIMLRVIKKAIYKSRRIDRPRKYAVFRLMKYAIFVFSVIIGLQLIGFDLSILLAGSAALLVGLGLGLQNLFSDFISGIIILVDSSVKVHDIIDVNGLICEVKEINFRTTTVLTRDDKYIILPNSDLTKNQLINWTHTNITSRFEISVGVDYSSDVNIVMNILKDATDQHSGVLKEPAAFVRFVDFGESSLNFTVFFWSAEVFRVEQIKSEIRVKIFDLFKANNITIPFPQRVIHAISKTI